MNLMAEVYRNIDFTNLDNYDVQFEVRCVKDRHNLYLTNGVRIIFVLEGAVIQPRLRQYGVHVQTQNRVTFCMQKPAIVLMITFYNIESEVVDRSVCFTRVLPFRSYFLTKLASKKLLNLLTPTNLYHLVGPRRIFMNIDYAIRGPKGITCSLAYVDQHDDISYYAHLWSTEFLFVICGEFRIDIWNGYSYVVSKGDLVIVPVGAFRRFVNVGDRGGILLVTTYGSDNSVVFPRDPIKKQVGTIPFHLSKLFIDYSI